MLSKPILSLSRPLLKWQYSSNYFVSAISEHLNKCLKNFHYFYSRKILKRNKHNLANRGNNNIFTPLSIRKLGFYFLLCDTNFLCFALLTQFNLALCTAPLLEFEKHHISPKNNNSNRFKQETVREIEQ